ncbi:MAG: DinB family protein [Burkholderiaceae bacterium]
MTTETGVMLAHYNDWADQRLFAAIGALPQGAVYRSSTTLFGSMLGTLNHNYQVDLIWRAHLLGRPHGFSSRRDLLHPVFENLVDAQSEVNRWYVDWAREQDEASLRQCSDFSFVSGRAAQMSRGGMFLHVINHKTYHRGWVSQMFFDFDARPPETDLCVFLCDVWEDVRKGYD